MSRVTTYPEDHWSLQVEIPYSMGVRQDELVVLSGQADLVGMGMVRHPGDLSRQTAAAMAHIAALLAELECGIEALAKLTVFYVDAGVDQACYLAEIGSLLDPRSRPVVTMVPLSHLFYPGAMVEIDAVAILDDESGETIADPAFGPVTDGIAQALRRGPYFLVGGTTAARADGTVASPWDPVAQTEAVLVRVEALLGALGADRDDLVKVNNWLAGGADAGAWARSAAIRASFYPEPGPPATGLPLGGLGAGSAPGIAPGVAPGIVASTDCWAMRGTDGARLPKRHACPEGHWDWPVHLPFSHGLECGGTIFVGGQVALDAEGSVLEPDDLASQTRISMDNVGRVLGAFGAGYRDILKLNTWYVGANDPARDGETLHTSVGIRSSYFEAPGPASTGIPLDALCFDRMVTETEVVARVTAQL